MMKIFFSGRDEDNFIEENTTLNDKVIDLTKHGFYLAVDGLDLGNLTPKTKYIEIEGANGKIDVSKIAVYFGGGGHMRAAGCDLQGSVYDVINNVTGQICKQFQETED